MDMGTVQNQHALALSKFQTELNPKQQNKMTCTIRPALFEAVLFILLDIPRKGSPAFNIENKIP